MFRNTFQKGFLSVFHSIGRWVKIWRGQCQFFNHFICSQPLSIWESKVQNGYIKRISDDDAKSLALEIRGLNVATTYISAPNSPCVNLGIKLPFLIIVVKNMRKSFSFEVQILDDQNQLRRFRSSNYQSKTRVTNFATSMPVKFHSNFSRIFS